MFKIKFLLSMPQLNTNSCDRKNKKNCLWRIRCPDLTGKTIAAKIKCTASSSSSSAYQFPVPVCSMTDQQLAQAFAFVSFLVILNLLLFVPPVVFLPSALQKKGKTSLGFLGPLLTRFQVSLSHIKKKKIHYSLLTYLVNEAPLVSMRTGVTLEACGRRLNTNRQLKCL